MRRRFASLLAALAMVVTGAPSALAADAPERIIDVVQIGWAGATGPAVSAADVERAVKADTIERWRKISNGQVVFTFGSTLPSLAVQAALPCDGYASLTYMSTIRTAVYKAAGITDDAHRFLIILSPKPTPDCIWDGRGSLGSIPSTNGTIILKNNADPEIIAHELGHNLGLGHSNLESCNGTKRDDVWANCKAIEYGSATDLMSNNDRDSTLSAYHLWRLGNIADADVAQPRSDQTVTLRPVSDTTGVRAVFIRDNTAAYWIEYRKADAKNQIAAGLVVYRADPPPGSSVLSPIASDAMDAPNTNVTTEVWMINLGDYLYAAPNSTGSPSLAPGAAFTTAFGGTTITASENLDGSASIRVKRAADRTAPAQPQLTAQSTWRTPTSELIAGEYLDTDAGIERFDARIVDAKGERIQALPITASKQWQRTFLNPLTPPANVRMQDLPEGTYTLALRGVDGAGNVSPWSETVQIQVDLGVPTVQPDFTLRPGASLPEVTAAWTGATDKGSGICTARTVSPEGFAFNTWAADTAGTPVFTTRVGSTLDSTTQVFDCLGNGVQGRLRLTPTLTTPGQMQRTGTWAADGATCTRTCTATFMSTATTTLLMRKGTATVLVNGKRFAAVPKSGKPAVRDVATIPAGKRITVTGSAFTFVGALAAKASWTGTGDVDRTALPKDSSLDTADQVALANRGLMQSDFDDEHLVLPMNKGTTTNDPSLDFCEASYPSEKERTQRRQVYVSKAKDDPYLFLSSESVSYSSPAAVAQAIAELDAAVTKCKADGGSKSTSGSLLAYVFKDLPSAATSVPGVTRRAFLINIGSGSTMRSMLLVYQFKDERMSNLYVIKDKPDSFAIDEILRWLDVATVIAKRL